MKFATTIKEWKKQQKEHDGYLPNLFVYYFQEFKKLIKNIFPRLR